MAIGNPSDYSSDFDAGPTAAAESKIVNEQTNVPNKNDALYYVPILRRGPYCFMEDAYSGTGGFRDGRYLIPHPRELFYDGRRDLSFYKNFTQSILDAMVTPVFNEPIQREVLINGVSKTEGYFINEFIADATNSGETLQMFIQETMTTAKLHGITFVVVDNFQAFPATKAEAINDRTLPYVYVKKANQLDVWECDRFGNIIWVQFIEESVPVKNAQGVMEKQKRFSRWDNLEYQLLTKNEKNEYVVIERYMHGLDEIPIIPVITGRRTDKKDLRIEPPLFDIAKINHAIYNKDSLIADQERAQGFAVFYIQTDKTKNMSIGTHNLINLPMEATIPPGYASPDAAILDGLVSNNEKLREDLFRIAGQKGVIAVEKAKSGTALAWEFTAQEAVLKATASLASWLENKIIELFKKYTNEEFKYSVVYKTDYKPDNRETNLVNYDKVIVMGEQPKIVKTLIGRQAFLENSDGIPDDDVKKAEQVYQKQIDDNMNDLEAESTDGPDDNVENEGVETPEMPETAVVK